MRRVKDEQSKHTHTFTNLKGTFFLNMYHHHKGETVYTGLDAFAVDSFGSAVGAAAASSLITFKVMCQKRA